MPVVQLLLAAPGSHDFIPRFGFFNQSLGLPAFYALLEELFPQFERIFFRCFNPAPQLRGRTDADARLFKSRQPVCQLARVRAGHHQLPSPAIPIDGSRQALFQQMQLSQG